MKKFSIKLTSLVATLAITASLLPMAVSASATKGTNLIADNDPSFERRTVSTTALGDAPFGETDKNWISRGTAYVDNTHAHSGSISIKVNGTGTGTRAVVTNLTQGKKYWISAWIYTEEGGKYMRMGIQGKDSAYTSYAYLTKNNWTQVCGVVTLPAGGDAATKGTTGIENAWALFVNVGNSSMGDFWIDDFEICEVTSDATPAMTTDGNVLGSNAGFELGSKNSWRDDSPHYYVVNSSVDANTGDCAAHTTRRTASYNTPQIYVEDDKLEDNTYYYARAMVKQASASNAAVTALMRMETQTKDADGNTIAGTTIPAPSNSVEINTSSYTKVASVFKNVDAKRVKVYVNTNETATTEGQLVDLWTDDYVLMPITASVAGATDVVPNRTITLNVPEDLADATLTIDKGAEITNIAKSGTIWTVTLDNMTYGVEYTLKLDTDLNQDPQWTFTTALDETNLLKNHDASFENREALEKYENAAWSDKKWIARGTWELVSDEAHTGIKSVKVTGNTSKHTGPRAVLTSADVEEGKLYYVSAYVKTTDEALKVKLGLGGSNGWSKSHTLTKGVWNKVEGVVTAPAAGDAAVIATFSEITDGYALYISQDCDTLGTMWVDDFVIYEVDSHYLADFAKDGNTINCTFANYKNNNNLMLAVAAYDADGKLVYVDTALSTSAKGTISVTAPDVSYDTGKVFLWEAKTLTPVKDFIDLSALA